MREILVVVASQSLALRLCVVDAVEPVRIQAHRPELPVQALDERAIHQLSGPGKSPEPYAAAALAGK